MLKVGGIGSRPWRSEHPVGHGPSSSAGWCHEDTDRLVSPSLLVLKDGPRGRARLEEELKAFVKDKLAPYKYPRWIEFVPPLPKTATGKIQPLQAALTA